MQLHHSDSIIGCICLDVGENIHFKAKLTDLSTLHSVIEHSCFTQYPLWDLIFSLYKQYPLRHANIDAASQCAKTIMKFPSANGVGTSDSDIIWTCGHFVDAMYRWTKTRLRKWLQIIQMTLMHHILATCDCIKEMLLILSRKVSSSENVWLRGHIDETKPYQ